MGNGSQAVVLHYGGDGRTRPHVRVYVQPGIAIEYEESFGSRLPERTVVARVDGDWCDDVRAGAGVQLTHIVVKALMDVTDSRHPDEIAKLRRLPADLLRNVSDAVLTAGEAIALREVELRYTGWRPGDIST